MSPAKKQYVLTGRSASLTFGLPDSDETLTLERGVPTEVPANFKDIVEDNDEVFAEGSVPEEAITGPPEPPLPADEEPADEAPPEPTATQA